MASVIKTKAGRARRVKTSSIMTGEPPWSADVPCYNSICKRVSLEIETAHAALSVLSSMINEPTMECSGAQSLIKRAQDALERASEGIARTRKAIKDVGESL